MILGFVFEFCNRRKTKKKFKTQIQVIHTLEGTLQ